MFTGLPVLLYHRVGPRDGSPMDRYTVSAARFAAQMAQLADRGWRVVPLEAALDPAAARRGARVAAITFDDGFASNREHAWPVLARHGFPSTTFVVSGELGGTNSWDGMDMPRYPLLRAADVAGADPALLAFQSHGASHASLPEVGDRELEGELRGSRARLGEVTGRLPALFAYPFGSHSARVREAVRAAGYRGACSCRGGRNNAGTDPYLLRRVEILEADIGWRLSLKLGTGVNFE
jgi:peptidoglycan/xylan/chitin deacetylase (PgdA/CDA1 family)